jgi:hypothetical protein
MLCALYHGRSISYSLIKRGTIIKNRKTSEQVRKNIAHKIHSTVSKLSEYYSQYHKFCKKDKAILFKISHVLTYGVHTAMESDAGKYSTPNPHVTNQRPLIGPWIVHFC